MSCGRWLSSESSCPCWPRPPVCGCAWRQPRTAQGCFIFTHTLRRAAHKQGDERYRQTVLSHAHTKTKVIKVPCWLSSQQGTLKNFIFGFRVLRCCGAPRRTPQRDRKPPSPRRKAASTPFKILEPTNPATPPEKPSASGLVVSARRPAVF